MRLMRNKPQRRGKKFGDALEELGGEIFKWGRLQPIARTWGCSIVV
jgi:hypothetical protein